MIMLAKAFAPASVANVAVGFDLLGFSFGVMGDEVLVERTDKPEVTIASISGVVTNITKDPLKNTATAGIVQMQKDLNLKFGFKVSIQKGIPMGSGMGGSSASAVAAIVAANALLDQPLASSQLVDYALIGEAQASGSYHADNIAPCLLGGLVLSRVRKTHKVEMTSVPLPKNIFCVSVLPELSVETKQARSILKSEISMATYIEQSANFAGFIAGCYRNDLELIRRSFSDVTIEPQRSHLIPGFNDVKNAALALGALGCSISGAGPSIFAWAFQKSNAEEILKSMLDAFKKNNVVARGWAQALNTEGAKLIP